MPESDASLWALLDADGELGEFDSPQALLAELTGQLLALRASGARVVVTVEPAL